MSSVSANEHEINVLKLKEQDELEPDNRMDDDLVAEANYKFDY